MKGAPLPEGSDRELVRNKVVEFLSEVGEVQPVHPDLIAKVLTGAFTRDVNPYRGTLQYRSCQHIRMGSVHHMILTMACERELRSIFFTGAAGTGKSFLLGHIVAGLRDKHRSNRGAVCVTASTGIAACSIGGVTLHSFAGVGLGHEDARALAQRVRTNRRARQRWRECKVLVVDEISMLDGRFFDKLESVARTVRQNSRPFGGIQLVLCGDFLQLPPVGLGPAPGPHETAAAASGGGRGGGRGGRDRAIFAFEASTWHRCVPIQVELTRVYRQKDNHFISVLHAVREGRVDDGVTTALAGAGERLAKPGASGTRPTVLFPRNVNVDQMNRTQLARCEGRAEEFLAQDTGAQRERQLKGCSAPERLTLRVGAQVVLLKNIDQNLGLVNGARGTVAAFVENRERATRSAFPTVPVVTFAVPVVGSCEAEEVQHTIEPATWQVEVAGEVVASRLAIPLKLAYALTVHKSQGMTIPLLQVNLAGCFESGQAYVALSRAVDLEGLEVKGFSAKAVKANPRVLAFYRQLRSRQPEMLGVVTELEAPLPAVEGDAEADASGEVEKAAGEEEDEEPVLLQLTPEQVEEKMRLETEFLERILMGAE